MSFCRSVFHFYAIQMLIDIHTFLRIVHMIAYI